MFPAKKFVLVQKIQNEMDIAMFKSFFAMEEKQRNEKRYDRINSSVREGITPRSSLP